MNVNTGSVTEDINDTTMAPLPDSNLQLGINGLHVRGQELYYDNTDKATFNKIPIYLATGHATGPAVTLVQSTIAEIFPDDFTVDFEGNVWMTADIWGQMDLLPSAAVSSSAAGTVRLDIVSGMKGDEVITGWTAAKFGTKEEDVRRGSLYITSNGGPVNYYFSNWTAGGMLLRLDTVDLGIY